ncbi:hypothetical protein ANCDUO_24805, partial [Ancylostoma duodenale]
TILAMSFEKISNVVPAGAGYFGPFSFTDLLMDLLYIPFFTVDALAIYHQNEFLYHVWHVYAMLVFGTSRMGYPNAGIVPRFSRKTYYKLLSSQ